jgi:hypothetical protein
MIVALSLLGYAGVLLTACARALTRARWPDSAPALVGSRIRPPVLTLASMRPARTR